MVTEKKDDKNHNLRDDNDGASKRAGGQAAAPDAKKKKRSAEDDDGAGPMDVVAEEELVGEEEADEPKDDDDDNGDEDEECERDAEGRCKKRRHIHPCVCDLTERQRKKIEKHMKHRLTMQFKFERRVKEIELELARLEEERLERERELQEQQELFGDEYELVGKKRKRKKRSARRASMVSLGVKQVINWKKQPRIEVKASVASALRKKYSAYCGRVAFPPSPPRATNFHKEPTLAVRATYASNARSEVNKRKKEWLIKHEDKRKLFQTPYYV